MIKSPWDSNSCYEVFKVGIQATVLISVNTLVIISVVRRSTGTDPEVNPAATLYSQHVHQQQPQYHACQGPHMRTREIVLPGVLNQKVCGQAWQLDFREYGFRAHR